MQINWLQFWTEVYFMEIIISWSCSSTQSPTKVFEVCPQLPAGGKPSGCGQICSQVFRALFKLCREREVLDGLLWDPNVAEYGKILSKLTLCFFLLYLNFMDMKIIKLPSFIQYFHESIFGQKTFCMVIFNKGTTSVL